MREDAGKQSLVAEIRAGDSEQRIDRRTAIKIGALAAATLAAGAFPFRWTEAATIRIPKNPNQLGWLYNQKKCIGCRSCIAACKKANDWEEGASWRRVLKAQAQDQNRYLSISCNHCERPACAEVCPVKAYTKRAKDGIVIHDATRCVGCKYCLYACPYQTPQYSEATGRISKCHFCYELQGKGEKPACVSSCPVNALTFGKLAALWKTPEGVAQLAGLPDPDLTRPSWVLIPKE
ncbi:MAG: 4Fe-4S dicluster domain-containing protein [Acidobacteriota bacterium]|jgi:anaerobic dimethyl sulfoxide reductase subunit B (iron-sulfur subunit)|nr:4Fe-4S dicluster domain-containing protein [Acidobacteriota bacterium]